MPLTRESLRETLTGQVILAPLTRGGNLPYRRLCATYGARITLSEMVFSKQLVRKTSRELALVRHHESEPVFGVQIAARDPELAVKAALIAVERGADFIDVNMGCPIDSVIRRGEGAALLEKPRRVEKIVASLRAALAVPVTVKIRTGYREGRENAVEIARAAVDSGADAITVHGRTREQRYRRPADWDRISEVAAAVSVPVIGNGDILTATDALHRLRTSGCAAVMAARGALINPWLWEDLASGAHRPRSAEERLAGMRLWLAFAMEHFRTDERGAQRLRPFLEFHVDFWRRYVPTDVDVEGDASIQGRPSFAPRNELEALLAADDDDGMARACDLVLEGADLHPAALERSGVRRDDSAGGWH